MPPQNNICDDDATAIIVPCYNEAKRLDTSAFKDLAAQNSNLHLFFVDDGSNDGTADLLRPICCENIHLLKQAQNKGKAEAVRIGMLHALKWNFRRIGFWDADLAVPLSELHYFLDTMKEKPEIMMLMGCRFKRMGADIQRNWLRHYISRTIKTILNFILNFECYDTQCGAKILDCAVVAQIMREPFHTRWLFDMEILCRIRDLMKEKFPQAIFEYPLHQWHEMPGSSVRVFSVIKDIGFLFFHYGR